MITLAELGSSSDVTWRTSSYSGNGAACVEVGWRRMDLALVRDSKDRAGGALAVDVPAWRAFLTVLARH
ncbi:DUF397 domain-containing protein [Haloechinothrix sp. LS1_15]|uniref:DUF397 domain-containing protein n=1 Tax=Haloechinothrix sp. LS1_15 TaxID=2652248 RepID=UPI0029475E1B|nr:DUF397 domain-containing protein [Haloechinothrix sp. LS1_15]MDV6011236.1 DUF397 domain-containing protein [Haloechinothrix sp. LS1_15]